MLGWNQVGRRLIVGTAILGRRNFAHSLCHGFPSRLYAERRAEGSNSAPRQHSRAPGVHVHAYTRTYIYVPYTRVYMRLHLRWILFASAKIASGGIPWQECLGNSLRARSHSIPLRISLPPFALAPRDLVSCLRRPRVSPQWCTDAAVCRCIVSIFTQGRRAGGLLSFPRFSYRRPPPVAPAKGDLTLRAPPVIRGEWIIMSVDLEIPTGRFRQYRLYPDSSLNMPLLFIV